MARTAARVARRVRTSRSSAGGLAPLPKEVLNRRGSAAAVKVDDLDVVAVGVQAARADRQRRDGGGRHPARQAAAARMGRGGEKSPCRAPTTPASPAGSEAIARWRVAPGS